VVGCLGKDINFEYKLIPLSGELKKLETTQKEPQQLADDYPAFKPWVSENKSSKEMVELKEWYKKHINPSGEVPTVEIDGKLVPESEISAEYLDASFPGHGVRLVPYDPYDAAKVRLAMKWLAPGISNIYSLLTNQEPAKDAELAGKIHSAFAQYFRLFVPDTEGPYFLGKEICLADIFAIPFVSRFTHVLYHYRGFKLIPDPQNDATFPWAARARTWWQSVEQRQSYQKTAVPAKDAIISYEAYAHGSIYKDGKLAGRGVSNTFSQ